MILCLQRVPRRFAYRDSDAPEAVTDPISLLALTLLLHDPLKIVLHLV